MITAVVLITNLALLTANLIAQTPDGFSALNKVWEQSPFIAIILALVIWFVVRTDNLHDKHVKDIANIVSKNQEANQPLVKAIEANTEATKASIPILIRVEKSMDTAAILSKIPTVVKGE